MVDICNQKNGNGPWSRKDKRKKKQIALTFEEEEIKTISFDLPIKSVG